ncbi:fatty acid desaturase [Synechococcus sp. ATX 2A4]|nr:fatty acid desaturase [Synechococcus sp. ATX 2A4]
MATAASESVQRLRGSHLCSLTGLWLAVLIVVAWLVSLLLLLQADLSGVVQTGLTAAQQLAHWQMPSTWFKAARVGAEILLRTFLQTGLFIVAHDAMHGSLIPAQPRWNHRLGRVALLLYACLPYGDCHRKHLQHHRCPGGSSDPDFHNGVNAHPTGWYLHFMRGYLSPPQICGLAAAWICMAALMASTTATIALNIAVFWVVPLVLSSMQLFLFGTYLPHRHGQAGDEAAHKVESLPLPALISLLSCYHFGFHWEHHQHPEAAWFELPSVHHRRWRGATTAP